MARKEGRPDVPGEETALADTSNQFGLMVEVHSAQASLRLNLFLPFGEKSVYFAKTGNFGRWERTSNQTTLNGLPFREGV